MAIVYKVWVEIERYDTDKTMEEALEFGEKVQDFAREVFNG